MPTTTNTSHSFPSFPSLDPLHLSLLFNPNPLPHHPPSSHSPLIYHEILSVASQPPQTYIHALVPLSTTSRSDTRAGVILGRRYWWDRFLRLKGGGCGRFVKTEGVVVMVVRYCCEEAKEGCGGGEKNDKVVVAVWGKGGNWSVRWFQRDNNDIVEEGKGKKKKDWGGWLGVTVRDTVATVVIGGEGKVLKRVGNGFSWKVERVLDGRNGRRLVEALWEKEWNAEMYRRKGSCDGKPQNAFAGKVSMCSTAYGAGGGSKRNGSSQVLGKGAYEDRCCEDECVSDREDEDCRKGNQKKLKIDHGLAQRLSLRCVK